MELDCFVKSLNEVGEGLNQLLKELQRNAKDKQEREKLVEGGGTNESRELVTEDSSNGTLENLTGMLVYVSVFFNKFGDIDTVQERFSADVIISARWRHPQFDGQHRNVELELKDWSSCWNPKLFVVNNISDLKETISCSVIYDRKSEATICQKQRVKGLFFEKMEFQYYPFDSQYLTVTLASELEVGEITVVADPSEVSAVNCQTFVDEQEWKLRHYIDTTPHSLALENAGDTVHHSAISFSCLATRRFNFFLYNIVLVVIFICGLIFTTFSIDSMLVQNRLVNSFVLVLATINFKYTITSTIPKVAYLTLLDKYVLASLGVVFTTCIWHGIVVHLTPSYTRLIADSVALAILLGFYILFNVVFFSVIIQRVSRSGDKYEIKENEHKANLQKLNEVRALYLAERQLSAQKTLNNNKTIL